MSKQNQNTGARLSVIIPSYNSVDTLECCLNALLRESLCSANELLVVDDASSDESRIIAQNLNVDTLCLQKNKGAGYARNAGAARSHNEILVFVDSDVALAPDALGRIADHFNANPKLSAVIGSYDDDPLASNIASQYRNLLHHITHQNSQTNASHFWSGIGAIRRSVFDRIGGFNQKKYGRTMEDVELGYRLRRDGHTILLDQNIQGKHLKRWSVRSIIYTDLFIRAIPWTRLILERGNMPSDFSLGFKQRMSVIAAWLILLFMILIPFYPAALIFAIVCIAGFIGLNLPLFQLIRSKYGVLKALVSIGLHWIHHFISGLGFASGVLGYGQKRLMRILSPAKISPNTRRYEDPAE